jgi:hypothetical protein
VIEPMRRVQDLIDAHPTLTRMYTTLSAEEMTLDPIFAFNADAPDVSNVHTADRIIECNPTVFQFEAPWRIELANGDVIRGTAEDAQSQNWPSALGALPANQRILQAGTSGGGKVLEDNSKPITAALGTYNEGVPTPSGSGSGDGDGSGSGSSDSSGCAIGTPSGTAWSALLAVLALAGARLGRRRRA